MHSNTHCSMCSWVFNWHTSSWFQDWQGVWRNVRLSWTLQASLFNLLDLYDPVCVFIRHNLGPMGETWRDRFFFDARSLWLSSEWHMFMFRMRSFSECPCSVFVWFWFALPNCSCECCYPTGVQRTSTRPAISRSLLRANGDAVFHDQCVFPHLPGWGL